MIHNSNGRWMLASQYFLYFGVMGIYLPFFNLYCYELGFSGWQIGALSAARSIVLIVFGIGWGLLADRYQRRRPIYVMCHFVSAALWGLYLLTTSFYGVLFATIAYGIFYAPIIAFMEAFAMDLLGKDEKSYGRLRVWGSVAFIIMMLGLGRVIDLYSVKIIISLILAGSWVQALVSLGFPKLAHTGGRAFGSDVKRLLSARMMVFLLCGFLMLASHGAYYAFFSIHLTTLGFDYFFIRLSWAIAVGAEILVMLFSRRIFNRFDYEAVLIFAFGAAVFRWVGLWAVASAAGILVLQITHAFTYGVFHIASILYIDALAPPETKTAAQAMNNAATYGLGLMVGFVICGALYETLGSPSLFAISALIAMLGGVVFQGFVVTQKKTPAAAE